MIEAIAALADAFAREGCTETIELRVPRDTWVRLYTECGELSAWGETSLALVQVMPVGAPHVTIRGQILDVNVRLSANA